jgi:mono/diheme cytochrome c family protein
MRSRTIVLGIIVTLAVVTLAGFVWTWRPSIARIVTDQTHTQDIQIIRRGAELAAVGNCNVCHTAPSGRPFAGALPLPTPFGTIYSTNITPDAETGIGAWSEAAFLRSMRDGVDRDGRHLYPAFPYDHFTIATDSDIRAIYAFLMSLPAVRTTAPRNGLVFPLNFRPILAGWKILFLRRDPFEQDSGKGAEWNRGQYLVEGLGHCGACHTPRNILGAEKTGSALAGGSADGWDAPALSSAATGRGWTVDQLTEYLSTGWHPLHSAAAGPMADVTNNLRKASATDVRAIAVYIASLSPRSERPKDSRASAQENATPNAAAEVVAIFNGSCAQCHNDKASIGPSNALPFSMSSTLRQTRAANTVRVILNGIQAYRETGGPYMPAFDGVLSDKQIASVAEYIRARYTSESRWTDIPNEISTARQATEK